LAAKGRREAAMPYHVACETVALVVSQRHQVRELQGASISSIRNGWTGEGGQLSLTLQGIGFLIFFCEINSSGFHQRE